PSPSSRTGISQNGTPREVRATEPSNFIRERSKKARRFGARFDITWLAGGMLIWMGGFLIGSFSFLLGRFRLHELSCLARPLGGGPGESIEWEALLQESCAKLGLRRSIALLESGEQTMPVTWGWCRAVILLPVEAHRWSIERRRVVLLHELAHIKRW